MKNIYHHNNGSFIGIILVSLLFAPCLFFPDTTAANTEIRYVSDMLIINLKTAVEAPFRVVTKLYSNDRLELLETEGKFSKVRTKDGEEGWIASQYLTRQTPKTLVIEELKAELESLRTGDKNNSAPEETASELGNLRLLNADLQDSNSKLVAENDSLTVLVSQLQNQLEQASSMNSQNTSHSDANEVVSQLLTKKQLLSKQVEELSIKNQSLQSTVEKLSSDRTFEEIKEKSTALAQENSTLRSKVKTLETERVFYWFIAGAVVFLAGMISGRIFGRKTRKLGY